MARAAASVWRLAFVKVVAGRVYSGKFTQQIRDQFTVLVRRAFNQLVAQRINDRLKAAMAGSHEAVEDTAPTPQAQSESVDEIVTTEEEFEAFFILS